MRINRVVIPAEKKPLAARRGRVKGKIEGGSEGIGGKGTRSVMLSDKSEGRVAREGAPET